MNFGFQLSAPTTSINPPKSAPTDKTKVEAKYSGPNDEEWASGSIEDYSIKNKNEI